MIVIKILGGLGNQMFQYAAGRALSLRKKVPLVLDTSAFSTYSLHQGFELLKIFNCNAPEVDQAAITKLLGWKAHPFIYRMVCKKREPFLRLKPKLLAIEPHFEYWPGIKELPDSCYLSGYWQSERYFADYAQTIREDFQFKEIPNSKNKEIVNRISSVNAVSLHVRRGDYISNSSIHPVCSLAFYAKAINYMVERVDNPMFFIFSDDISWAKENLDIKFPVEYIDFNHEKYSYNDMRLMSLCKHHIIANSSFSWWGAWLNESNNKIVVAPKSWFSAESGINDIDLVPKDWVRL